LTADTFLEVLEFGANKLSW